MKRRKNPIYKGQSTRVGAGTGDRVFVNSFYKHLNEKLRPEDEIEIIPPEQVNPTHSVQDQAFIMADYCVRKILPEVTSLFRWGDKVTPRLRALAPVVDRETAKAAARVAGDAYLAVATYGVPADAADAAAYAAYAYSAADAAAYVAVYADDAAYDAAYVFRAVRCVYYALVVCIEADREAAYDRIIALTNEMLESL